MQRPFFSLFSGAAAGIFAILAASPALADKIKHPVAIFAGLDKITGRIISFEVNIDETVQFGSLQVTPRVCYTRPATEAPHTTGFVEVEEIEKENQFKKIFSDWMFAASPGLSAAEHPVYDVWLTDCKGGSVVIREVRAVEETPPDTNRPASATDKPDSPAERPQRAARPTQQRPPSQAGAPTALPAPGSPPLPLPAPAPAQARAPEPRRAPTQSFFPTLPSGPAQRRENTYYAQ